MLSSKFQSEIKKVLFENPLIQANELINRGYFGLAIVTIMSYLELSINNIISRLEDLPTRKRNFRSMINRIVELKIMDTQQMQMLSQWRVIRNDILHHNIYPIAEQTQEVINGAKSIVDFLKLIETPAYLWWRVLNDQDRKVLIKKFLLTLYRQSKKATKEAPTIASKRIFDAMGLRAYSDIITPMIVKSLEVRGYITVADGDKVQLTEKGKAESEEQSNTYDDRVKGLKASSDLHSIKFNITDYTIENQLLFFETFDSKNKLLYQYMYYLSSFSFVIYIVLVIAYRSYRSGTLTETVITLGLFAGVVAEASSP